jgi:hypothetical protein
VSNGIDARDAFLACLKRTHLRHQGARDAGLQRTHVAAHVCNTTNVPQNLAAVAAKRSVIWKRVERVHCPVQRARIARINDALHSGRICAIRAPLHQ